MTEEKKTQQTDARARKGFLAVLVGLLSNILLAALKTSFGVLGHSPALLADGINSTSDVAYYLVVSVFVRVASKPADEDHPYGHSQLESIGALVVGSFVITTAVAIFWNSIDTIFDLIAGVGSFTGGSSATLIIALATVLIKIILTVYTNAVGKSTENPSIAALAYDHRNDIYSALAAMIGIALGRQGFYWVDPMAGALVALVILWTGVGILRDSTADLMDTIPGRVLQNQIHELLDPQGDVKQIEDIHAHRFGPYLVINLTIGVDGSISVLEGDHIATMVEKKLRNNIEFVRTVHVHYHPFKEELSIEEEAENAPVAAPGG